MVRGKGQSERKNNGSLIKELDGAIALLTRALALAASNDESTKAVMPNSTGKRVKRTLSPDAREAIAVAQRKRWAKARREKKRVQRAGVAK